MSSKAQKKHPNWGGARPNSGPKPQTLSGERIKEMLKAEREAAKKNGLSMDEQLLKDFYDTDSLNLRTQIWKAWKNFTTAPVTEGSETDKDLGPAVFLPEQRPELEAIKGGKED